MADHTHDPSHSHDHEGGDSYFIDQLCMVALSGAFGAICLTLWFWQRNMLNLMLGSQFHYYVLGSGFVLVALALMRGYILWGQSKDPAFAGGHTHDHDHDHDHAHAIQEKPAHLHSVQAPSLHVHVHDDSCGHEHKPGEACGSSCSCSACRTSRRQSWGIWAAQPLRSLRKPSRIFSASGWVRIRSRS
jgi:ABC-type nickel/cobalt efflux system permease component RcnA